MPTGRSDIGLEPCEENVSFLRSLRRDFDKVKSLLELVIDREKLKCKQVGLATLCLFVLVITFFSFHSVDIGSYK